MKKEELKSLMDSTLDQAKSFLLRDGKLFPVAFMHIESQREIHVIGLSFRNPREKDMQIAFLKKLVKEKNADAVFVAIESWYVAVHKEKGRFPDLKTPPSERPDRKECIFLTGESEEGEYTIVQLFERKGDEITFTEKFDMGEEMKITKFNFGIRERKKQKIEKKGLS